MTPITKPPTSIFAIRYQIVILIPKSHSDDVISTLHNAWSHMLATPELLRTFQLFQGLDAQDIEYLCSKSVVERHARRSVILNAGVTENRVCMLFEGKLQGVDFTIDGREVGLYFVDPGNYCGELCVFDPGIQTEHVIALNSSVVVIFAAETIRSVAEKNPKIMLSLGTKLAYRIRQMENQRALLSLPNVVQRVCSQLWLLVPDQSQNPNNTAEINNLPTHMEIAIMLNLSRETITRVFQQLQRNQIVKRVGQNRLAIENIEALRKLVEGNNNA